MPFGRISNTRPPIGRRERKKLATRNALIATAKRMFAEQGYAATTLEKICDAVDIHVTTFFNYFASKEELVFANMLETFEELRVAIAARPAGVSVIEFWWSFLGRIPAERRRDEMAAIIGFDSVPALRSRYVNVIRQYQDLLAQELAEEAGNDPRTDVYAQLQAAMLLSTLLTASRWILIAQEDRADMRAGEAIARRVLEAFPSRAELEPLIQASGPRRKAAARKAGG